MNAIQARRILTLAFLAIAALSSAHAQMSDVQKFQIHMTDPTYTGLPIWIYAESSFPLEIHYPYGEDPEDFGPNRLEVKRSEEHTSELQSLRHLVCRLLLEKKN